MDLKEFIGENKIIAVSEKRMDVCKTRIPEEIMKLINLQTLTCREKLSEKIYWILNDIKEYPDCTICSRKYHPKYYGLKLGYKNSEYCSIDCIALCEKIKQKRTDSYFDRTGFTYPQKNPAVVEVTRNTNLAIYGFKYIFQDKELRKQWAKEYLEKTGYSSTGLNPEVQEKNRITNLSRLGCEYPYQNLEILKKVQRYRTKKLIMPSGKIINFQGFEDIAILKLLDLFSEDELVLSRKKIPKFWYFKENDEKKHIYFPDIYIPGKNLIIEVKSEWTYNRYFEINMLKKQSCIDAGYDYKFWICSNKNVLKIIN